jgi:serine/threonine-protein kinase PRP4
VKAIPVPDKPSRDLAYLLNVNDGDYNIDKKALQNLKDLLEKCLSLDPSKRMTPEEALKHPFLAQFSSENKYRK